MVTTIAVTQAIRTIREARELLNLSQVDASFFLEWQRSLPDLTASESAELARLKERYLYYLEDGEISEGTANFIILSPLLNVLGLCDPPYKIAGEQWTRLALQTETDKGPVTLEGRLDALVLQDKLWLVVIEGKRGGFNVLQAIPQTLAYMMASPIRNRPLFGLCSNGYDYIFIKLQKGETNQYSLSHNFTLLSDPTQNLIRVGQILRSLASNK